MGGVRRRNEEVVANQCRFFENLKVLLTKQNKTGRAGLCSQSVITYKKCSSDLKDTI